MCVKRFFSVYLLQTEAKAPEQEVVEQEVVDLLVGLSSSLEGSADESSDDNQAIPFSESLPLPVVSKVMWMCEYVTCTIEL